MSTRIPWNKGMKGLSTGGRHPKGHNLVFKDCSICGGSFQSFVSQHRKCCSKECANANLSLALKERYSHIRHQSKINWVEINCIVCKKPFLVKPNRKDIAKCCSLKCSGITRSRDNNINWRGGVTSPLKLLRRSPEYRKWRLSVFHRDNYTCQECGITDVYLEAHHILPFAMYEESRFDLDNGVSLCKDCHKKTDTYGYGTKKLIMQKND